MIENPTIIESDFRQELESERGKEINMKTIVLKKLELINFKGTVHRVEVFENGINDIFGANGTGKTTLFDAFTWLLFGKDSQGMSDKKANIKTLDADNKPIMHTDNVVEGTFDINGEELVLRRTYKEMWHKPSGAVDKVYGGQTTEYSWNGNDRIGETEYKKRVAEIIDEKLFKLITDPNYFASLKMDERREIVLNMAGEVTDEEIKFMCPDLALFDPKGNVKDCRDTAMSSRLKLTKDRDNYPARIDELKRTIMQKQEELKELDLPDKAALETDITNCKTELAYLEDQQSNVNIMVDEIMKKNNERLEKQRLAEQYKITKQADANAKVNELNRANELSQKTVKSVEEDIAMITSRIENGKKTVVTKQEELKVIAEKMKNLQAQEKPDFETETICPTCHREFELDTIESKKEELLANWIGEQKKKIDSLKNEGNVVNADVVRYKEAVAKLETELKELESKRSESSDTPIEHKEYEAIDFAKDEEYQKLVNAIPVEVSITEEIEQRKVDVISKKEVTNDKLAALNERMQMFTKVDILNADIASSETRIETLLAEEKNVNVGIANQEKTIYLCDLWTKTKVELLNRRVADKFEMVKFKMFSFTREGNPVPTCEIVVNGVDYVSLNTASRINAGLDIINALIKHYEVKAPIFIDGRESVTAINAPDTQIINLIVKEEN